MTRKCQGVVVSVVLVFSACASAAPTTSASTAAPTTTIATTAPTPTTATAPTPTKAPATASRATTTVAPTLAPTTQLAVPEPNCIRIAEFVDEEAAQWGIVNDSVMGGLSEGGAAIVDGHLLFAGVINTNGGGFSSVRARLDQGLAPDTTSLRLRAKTDRRMYEFLADDAMEGRNRRVTHYALLHFDDEADQDGWQIGEVQFEELEARVFGTPVEAMRFAPALATSYGIILADGVDGPFELQIDWIEACSSSGFASS